jgi:hypothetical protein
MALFPCNDPHPGGVPLLPLPSLNTHRSERKERDGPVSLAEFDAGTDGGVGGREGDVGVDPEIAGEGEIEWVKRGGAG